MRPTIKGGMAAADSFLSLRTRYIFRWYAWGFLNEAEAVRLIGAACLEWLTLRREGGVQRTGNARDAI
ncbi:MAG: hypothetical protein ACM3XS_03455 [Bacteroidota bacterium]